MRQIRLHKCKAFKMLAKSVVLILLLFITGGLTSESCDKESCKNDETGESQPGCGCSVNREHTKDTKPEPIADDSGKYSTQANVKSPYSRTNEMVLIPGGSFTMGSNEPIFVADGEGPARKTTVSQFYMDIHEVSNAEFELFVNTTGYVTEVFE